MRMDSPDINVLIYAFDQSAPHHEKFRAWLEARVNGTVPFGLADPVWSGFIRITTNQRLFQKPVSLDASLSFVERLRSSPMCRSLAPGERHWDIFLRLCRQTRAVANDIPDVYLAALAIEADSSWITTDMGFARFEGLNWRHPLQAESTGRLD